MRNKKIIALVLILTTILSIFSLPASAAEKIENKMREILKQNLTFEKYEVEDVDAKIAEFKAQGEIYKAELLEEHRNDNPTLYLTKDKDGNVKIGTPYLAGAKVMAKVVKQGKDKKILVYKYKSKANYRRRQGHRQPYTKVSIEKIEA